MSAQRHLAWDVLSPLDITIESLEPVFAVAAEAGLFILGAGKDGWAVPEPLRWRFRDARLGLESMTTGAAVRTYNILVAEQRRVAAGLIALG